MKIFVNSSPNCIWAGCLLCVDPAECTDDVCMLKDEGLAAGAWNRTGVCHSLHLKAGEEPVQLLRLRDTSTGSAVDVVLPGDVMYPLPCPKGVRADKEVFDGMTILAKSN